MRIERREDLMRGIWLAGAGLALFTILIAVVTWDVNRDSTRSPSFVRFLTTLVNFGMFLWVMKQTFPGFHKDLVYLAVLYPSERISRWYRLYRDLRRRLF
jgi:hypothetical protein